MLLVELEPFPDACQGLQINGSFLKPPRDPSGVDFGGFREPELIKLAYENTVRPGVKHKGNAVGQNAELRKVRLYVLFE